MSEDKIKEQFHYFNIQADIDYVYGFWVVSADGDVINYLYPYAILAIHLKNIDWLEKMKTKVWFKTEYECSLKQAIDRVNEIFSSKKR